MSITDLGAKRIQGESNVGADSVRMLRLDTLCRLKVSRKKTGRQIKSRLKACDYNNNKAHDKLNLADKCIMRL